MTATKVCRSIAVFSQVTFPKIPRDYHIPMHLHSLMISPISVGSSFFLDGSVDEGIATTVSPTSRTEHIIPRSLGNWFIFVHVHLFDVFITCGRFECL